MSKLYAFGFIVFVGILLIWACKKPSLSDECMPNNDKPTPYVLKVPPTFPQPNIPKTNPMTVEGINLGRHLFWDPILSKDSTLACAGCHAPNAGFGDQLQTSLGVEGIAGKRNSMPLFNLAFYPAFLWDGSAATLEEQILKPVPDPVEMHLDWKSAAERLQNHDLYPDLFAKAFDNCTPIDSTTTAKAIAQFLRTMVSASSKYDKAVRIDMSGPNVRLSEEELEGESIFHNDYYDGGHCLHCHQAPLFATTDDFFRNNGLDAWSDPSELDDLGLGGFTCSPKDAGKFKNMSLRNIELTAPYMHDGRFATLEEAIEHYISGVQDSPTLDFNIESEFLLTGGLHLPENGKENLIAFLKTLTDWDFVNDTTFHSPFK